MFVTNFWTCDRQQDVRATEIDKVEMHSSFRSGDIVKALVVSSTSTENLFFQISRCLDFIMCMCMHIYTHKTLLVTSTIVVL